ncbi:MAG: hypothetical protein M1828_004212 [Chrysothrix sp. TS-e1954]|nr:MAG: hypothetical protein M1828_004212 [Chrysothrix sp. TS-e1954]
MKRTIKHRPLLQREQPYSKPVAVYRSRYYATTNSGQAYAKPRTAIFFPGQGVQRVGMVKSWMEAFPQTVKPFMEEVDSILKVPLTRMIEEGPNSVINATEVSQPAIMATSVMALHVMEQHFGFKTDERVDFTLGHSLGEFAALVTGGYLQFQDALRMVRKRGEVMAQCSKEAEEKGGEVGMIALVCEPDRLDSLIEAIHDFVGYGSAGSKADSAENMAPVDQVLIANINSKNQVVLSGTISRIRTLLTNLREFGGHDPRAVQLKSESPFHSPLMQPAAETMKRLLRRPTQVGKDDLVTFPGRMPCVSNVTAKPFESREQLKDLLSRQCVETVLWWDSIKFLDQEQKVRRWIGVGPGKVGRNLIGKEVGMKGEVKGGGVWSISDPREIEDALKGLDSTEQVQVD